MSCSAQMPVAVASEVREISGMWPWWTVIVPARASSRNARNSSAPVTSAPPDSDVSITTSSVKTCRKAAQSLVSRARKYRAFSCLIASVSSMVRECLLR